MKQFLAICLLAFGWNVQAQTHSYISSSSEMIFSFAKIKNNGVDVSSDLRWSPVFNIETVSNTDFSDHFGMFAGLAIRNVGFIYEPKSDSLKKFRTYNLGIPIGIKLGNLKGTFLFGGYEFEIPYSYKEKLFIGDSKKTVETDWFSPKVNPYVQSLFCGINFKSGLCVKFKYYIDNFFNADYTELQNGVKVKPFSQFKANVFYISTSWDVFKDVKTQKMKKRKKMELQTAL